MRSAQDPVPEPASGPAPDFNALAGVYRWLEFLSFGPCLWHCRIHFLRQLSQYRKALVLGDGDGRFTARLLRANPAIQVHAVDLSVQMLRSLEDAARPFQNRLKTEAADLRQWQPPPEAHYDLFVAHFLLDCLTAEETYTLARRLTLFAAPNALWLVSEFAVPATAFGRCVAAPLVASLYSAFGMLTGLRLRSLPDYGLALRRAGWALASEKTHLRGLLVSQLWRLK